MELLSSEKNYILISSDLALLINRQNGEYSIANAKETLKDPELVCHGKVYGFIGKLQFSANSEPRLIFIRKRSLVGVLKGCEIYRIVSVACIPLDGEIEGRLNLDPCNNPNHKRDLIHNTSSTQVSESIGSKIRGKTNVKNAASTPLLIGSKKSGVDRTAEKLEKRMLEEFQKLFSESESFYYSQYYDITNTLQRQFIAENERKEKIPLWMKADSRFFWNYYMISELVDYKDDVNRFIIPIIQGFIQFCTCELDQLYDNLNPDELAVKSQIDLCIISRRSRHRAGTRYLRRGVDEDGHVANYVETEQVVIYKAHSLSFTQIRGSIPIFWSQPGFRYRPLPRLERTPEETFSSCAKHFERESSIYGPIIVVSLVEKNGKEKVLADAYLDNILKYDSSDITYVAYDFHERCRGMHFENVNEIIIRLEDHLKDMSYYWSDSYGVVHFQRGVTRINCVDCLDRTNIVMSFIAKFVLCIQLSKLGLIIPEYGLPANLKAKFQTIWANNGDTISKQYAGTNALKGDFTRTGERKLAGALRDGMNSANRFYLNRFKDASRQALLDLMLGHKKYITEADLTINEKGTEEKEITAEQLKIVIDDVKKSIIQENEVALGFGLINAKNDEVDLMDIDTILILTEFDYIVVDYDYTMDSVTEIQKVGLQNIVEIEIGFEPSQNQSNIFALFHTGGQSSQQQLTKVPNLRIIYSTSEGELLFHQFKSSSYRFFNNIPIPIQHDEEMLDSLRGIAHSFQASSSALTGKTFEIKEFSVLPHREQSKSNVQSFASSFVQRYILFGQTEAVETKDDNSKKKSQQPSLNERFTPKYFRRSSAVLPKDSSKSEIDSKNGEEVNENDQLNKETNKMMHKNNDSRKNSKNEEHDIIHLSCGLVHVKPNNHLESHKTVDNDKTEFSDEVQQRKISRQYSVPEDIFSINANQSVPLKPIEFNILPRAPTPEIRVTENDQFSKASLGVTFGNIPKRLSKSSEEINKVLTPKSAPVQFSNKKKTAEASFGKFLNLTNEYRSTSENDLVGTINMKGSHSESTLAQNNKQQQPQNQNISSTFKKDIVFSPLGKFARNVQNIGVNYLDPRKLRESLRTNQTKVKNLEQDEYSKKAPENVDELLNERIKNSKSSIISF